MAWSRHCFDFKAFARKTLSGMNLSIYVSIYIYICIYAQTRIHLHTHTHTHTHTRTHACLHIHIQVGTVATFFPVHSLRVGNMIVQDMCMHDKTYNIIPSSHAGTYAYVFAKFRSPLDSSLSNDYGANIWEFLLPLTNIMNACRYSLNSAHLSIDPFQRTIELTFENFSCRLQAHS